MKVSKYCGRDGYYCMGQKSDYLHSAVSALNARARAEIQKDNFLTAVKLLKMSLTYSPDNSETWELLSLCYFGLRKNGVGAECRSRALTNM